MSVMSLQVKREPASRGRDIFSHREWGKLIGDLTLSPRQAEIVRHLFHGLGDKQIAQELSVALPTVRTHLNRLFSKFDVHDRSELILYVFWQFRHGNGSSRCRQNR